MEIAFLLSSPFFIWEYRRKVIYVYGVSLHFGMLFFFSMALLLLQQILYIYVKHIDYIYARWYIYALFLLHLYTWFNVTSKNSHFHISLREGKWQAVHRIYREQQKTEASSREYIWAFLSLSCLIYISSCSRDTGCLYMKCIGDGCYSVSHCCIYILFVLYA